MENLLENIFYGVYIIAAAFLLLVLYVNSTNRRLRFLLKKINKLSGTDENENFPESKIKRNSSKILRKLVLLRQKLSERAIKKVIYEYFLSANVITVIGSIMLAVGIGFFVRYPIFNIHMSIIGRIIAALLVGVVLIFSSHSLRKKHPAYSSVVMGAAFSILYFTFITAYYNYHLFGIGTAFIIAFSITVFVVLLSVLYNRYSLVTLAILAAFSTPFLVNYDNSNPQLLFNYILMLDIGVLVFVAFKKRIFLNLTALTFTGIYFVIWLIQAFKLQDFRHFELSFLYVFIFYTVLMAIHSISNIIRKSIFLPFELSSILGMNMIVYALGFSVINEINPEWNGLYTALMAIFNLLFLIFFLKYAKHNQRLIYLIIGLVIVFTTFIPLVEMVGRSITMVWALQLILLLWISQKIDVLIMKMGAVFISIGLIVSTTSGLFSVLSQISPLAVPKTVLINIDFLSGMMASISMFVSIILLSREKGEFVFKPLKVRLYQALLGAASVFLFYFSLYTEIKYQLTIHVSSEYAQLIFMSIFNFSFVILMLLPSIFLKVRKLKIIGAIGGLLATLGYFIFYYLVTVKARSELISSGGITATQFYCVFIIDLLVAGMLLLTHFNLKIVYKDKKVWNAFTLWPLVIFIISVLSLGMDHYIIINNTKNGIITPETLEQVHRMPYTVLWALSAVLLTIIGVFFRIRQIRQIAIFTVFVVLMKLFIRDFAYMDLPERTISFVSVGSVLLVIALIYQFNKKKFEPGELHE